VLANPYPFLLAVVSNTAYNFRTMNKNILLGWAFPALCVLAGTLLFTPRVQAQEVEKLNQFFDAFLEKYLPAHPTEAANWGDHRFDDQVEVLTPEARAKRSQFIEKTLAEL
jgi:hypothetical protein